MLGVVLKSETDFDGWRAEARRLLMAEVRPQDVVWSVGGATDLLASSATPPPASTSPFTVPRAFIELAEQVKEMTAYSRDHAITIAVMGCRVNGPGETDDADLGLWCGPKHVTLKRGPQELGVFPYGEILVQLRRELDAIIAGRVAAVLH